METLQIIRPSELAKLLSVDPATVWRWEKKGELPARKKLTSSGRAVGWLKSDIQEWMDSRPDADQESQSNIQSLN